MNKIRVLVIEDSLITQKIIKTLIEFNPDLEVVGFCADAFEAKSQLKNLNPDVVTLDIQLPQVSGLVLLEKMMKHFPLPVIMLSSLTNQGAEASIKAIQLGAVDFINKPHFNNSDQVEIESYARLLGSKIRNSAKLKREIIESRLKKNPSSKLKQPLEQFTYYEDAVICIGASTGGVEAVECILQSLPEQFPPIIVAQHIPPLFSQSLANSYNKKVKLNVMEAQNNQALESNHVYIAPGDYHLRVQKNHSGLFLTVCQDEKFNYHRPSIDVLFQSIASFATPHTIGVILSGMGSDGANGLLQLKQLGCITIAQDKETSLVWGMPKNAVQINAATHILPIHEIANFLNQLCKKKSELNARSIS